MGETVGGGWAGRQVRVELVRTAGSPPLLAVDGERQRDVERVVVLDQRRVLVVQHQLLQGAVQVVGLSEAVAGAGLVDDAVFDLAVHPETEDTKGKVRNEDGTSVFNKDV